MPCIKVIFILNGNIWRRDTYRSQSSIRHVYVSECLYMYMNTRLGTVNKTRSLFSIAEIVLGKTLSIFVGAFSMSNVYSHIFDILDNGAIDDKNIIP